MMVRETEPVPPRSSAPHIPRDLETICLKCLEKDGRNRYATAENVSAELTRFLQRRPIHARPIGRPQRFWRWCRRNPAVAISTMMAAGLLLVLAIGGPIVAIREGSLRWDAEQSATNERLARENEAEQRRLAETRLVDMYTLFGLVADEKEKSQAAVLWFAKAAELGYDSSDRAIANRIRFTSWSRQIPSPLRAFQRDGSQLRSMSFHPSGLFLMLHDREFHCEIWDIDGECQFEFAGIGPEWTAGSWNPAGDLLALADSPTSINIYSFPGGMKLRSIPWQDPAYVLAFCPNGRYLAIGGTSVRVWDCHDEQFATATFPHPDRVVKIGFNSRGDRCATACVDQYARVFAIPDRQMKKGPLFPPIPNRYCVQFGKEKPNEPRFIDDDRILLTTTHAGEIATWDAESGEQIRVSPVGQRDMGFFAASHGGTLAAGGGAGWSRIWDLSNGRVRRICLDSETSCSGRLLVLTTACC